MVLQNYHVVIETNKDGVYSEAISIFVPMSEGNKDNK